jgi:hypothetical protein
MFLHKHHTLPNELTYHRNGTLDAPKHSEHVSAESILTAGGKSIPIGWGNSQNESRMWWQAFSSEPVRCAPMHHQPTTGT